MVYRLTRNRIEQRFLTKQLRIDDILVFDEDIPKNSKLSFVDFAPTLKVYKGEGIKSVNYSAIVEFANKWLTNTECWDVIGCETIPAIIKIFINYRGEIEGKEILKIFALNEDRTKNSIATMKINVGLSQRITEVEFPILMLRLWIKPFDNKDEKLKPIVPQIQYKDFAPNLMKDNEFENIDCVIQRVNESVNRDAINGKIINVQTLGCSAEQDWAIDTESTQMKTWIGKLVYILRVFFILGPIHEEEVGFADFVPECLSGGNLFKRPKFEKQSDLLRKASKWLSDNPEINFCSAQSIDVKLKSMVTIDTKQMAITRKTGDYIRVIRIAYTKPKDLSADIPMSSTLPPPPPLYLVNNVFVLHKSYSETKKCLNEFLDRIEWNAEQQYKWILLNCETVLVLSSNGLKTSLEHNSDKSFQVIFSAKSEINSNQFFALKLYYDVGFYGIDQIQAKTENEIITKNHCCIAM